MNFLNQDWILHDSHNDFFRKPFGAVTCNGEVELKLKVLCEDLELVTLRFNLDGNVEQEYIMEKIDDQEGVKVYRVFIKTPSDPGLLWYYFMVCRDGKKYYYGNTMGLGGQGGITDEPPKPYQITVYQDYSSVPQWFRNGVMYQIFVDRFLNGCEDGKVLDPKKNSLLQSHWENTPLYIFERNSGEISRWNFFGGNLLGVKKKLPYLKELGVNIIYFNPLFEAPSNHKYDTGDYHKIDPMFGDNQLFWELCAEAREMGISIILDGVFSHTGSDSVYFNKDGNYDSQGAYQSKDSPYYEWYKFKEHPNSYDCWWNIDTLPNVNELEPSYQDFIINNENSVLKHWQRAGIKGWRLDVVDELPGEFVKKIRRTMKELDPESILIGEVWEDASNKTSYGLRREYLLGDELDSVMNYPFRSIVLEFITGQRDSSITNLGLMNLKENYPVEHFYSAMNLIGSHDVPRVLTIIKASLPYSLSGESKDEISLGLLKLLVLWQMTLPGVPCIYYGDEARMEGWQDPLNRGTYPWGRENKELIHWYQRIIALRKHYDILRTGYWMPLEAPNNICAFVRFSENGQDVFGHSIRENSAIVLLNRNRDHENHLSLEVSQWCQVEELLDALNNYQAVKLEDGRINLTLGPLEGKILLQNRWESSVRVKRDCGILLHPTSLPSKQGIGDLGPEAYKFIDFLARSQQKLWQILPLNPPGEHGSPYQCFSAFAGNPMLISLESLVEVGQLSWKDLQSTPSFDGDKVEFGRVKEYKDKLLKIAFQSFRSLADKQLYQSFLEENKNWLDDYALFMALKDHFHGSAWNRWDKTISKREEEALNSYRTLLAVEIDYHKFLQFEFFRQWQKLKDYANNQGIRIIGDLPIFVAHDSSDVWVSPGFFELDEEGNTAKVAGVPPDYFSQTGQRWGNPLYKWAELEKDEYKWWRERFQTLFTLVDIVRIDHFRGFEAYWEIPAGEETAVKGRWVKGPGEKFFLTIKKYLGEIPIIAEDLGFITPEVEELRLKCGFPGMKIMQFEMKASDAEFKFQLSKKNNVVYTGSHDNDTILGWYRENGCDGEPEDISWRFIEMAYHSDAETVIIPLQDVLSLGSEGRMNTPGTIEGNWRWRFKAGVLTREREEKLRHLAEKYMR